MNKNIDISIKNKSLPDIINMFIEYNGEQHYNPVMFGGMSKIKATLTFNEQCIRDANFRKYCIENNFFLQEINR